MLAQILPVCVIIGFLALVAGVLDATPRWQPEGAYPQILTLRVKLYADASLRRVTILTPRHVSRSVLLRAEAAVRELRFEPRLEDGVSVAYERNVTIRVDRTSTELVSLL